MRELLGKLRPGTTARVVRIVSGGALSASSERKLLEAGFLAGSRVDVLHEGPIGSDPLAVRVRGALVAIRLADANSIEVEV